MFGLLRMILAQRGIETEIDRYAKRRMNKTVDD